MNDFLFINYCSSFNACNVIVHVHVLYGTTKVHGVKTAQAIGTIIFSFEHSYVRTVYCKGLLNMCAKTCYTFKNMIESSDWVMQSGHQKHETFLTKVFLMYGEITRKGVCKKDLYVGSVLTNCMYNVLIKVLCDTGYVW